MKMIKQMMSATFGTDGDYDTIEEMCKHERLHIPGLDIYGQKWYCVPYVKRVIINNPATIILWQDDTKTICKCSEGEEFDIEKGIAMCFMKKMFGNPSQVRKFIDKWRPDSIVATERSQNLIKSGKFYTFKDTAMEGRLDLVSCKDCKYFNRQSSYSDQGICNKHITYMDCDGYCSKGERHETD